jgi:hypothetical protein
VLYLIKNAQTGIKDKIKAIADKIIPIFPLLLLSRNDFIPNKIPSIAIPRAISLYDLPVVTIVGSIKELFCIFKNSVWYNS